MKTVITTDVGGAVQRLPYEHERFQFDERSLRHFLSRESTGTNNSGSGTIAEGCAD